MVEFVGALGGLIAVEDWLLAGTVAGHGGTGSLGNRVLAEIARLCEVVRYATGESWGGERLGPRRDP